MHPVRVGVVAVDLVDGDDDRHLGRLGVVDRLDGLGHDAVVGGDDQHDDVGGLGAAGPHGGERLVAGGVDEGDRLAVLLDLVGADVLGDAAGLAGDDVGVADAVEQQRLAVVDVAHDGDDRRARRAAASSSSSSSSSNSCLELDLLLLAGVDEPDLGADLGREQLDLSSVRLAEVHRDHVDVDRRGGLRERRRRLQGERLPVVLGRVRVDVRAPAVGHRPRGCRSGRRRSAARCGCRSRGAGRS